MVGEIRRQYPEPKTTCSEKSPDALVYHAVCLDLPKGAHTFFETVFSVMDGGLEAVLSNILQRSFARASRERPDLVKSSADTLALRTDCSYVQAGFERKCYAVTLSHGAAQMIEASRRTPGGGIEATLSRYFTHANGRLHEHDYCLPMVVPTRGRPRGSGPSR